MMTLDAFSNIQAAKPHTTGILWVSIVLPHCHVLMKIPTLSVYNSYWSYRFSHCANTPTTYAEGDGRWQIQTVVSGLFYYFRKTP